VASREAKARGYEPGPFFSFTSKGGRLRPARGRERRPNIIEEAFSAGCLRHLPMFCQGQALTTAKNLGGAVTRAKSDRRTCST